MRKVLLLKSLEDFYDMDYTGDRESINPLSMALTKKFLPKWSDSTLKNEIISRFHCLPCLRLRLTVQCEQGSDIVNALSLHVKQYDLEREYWKDKVINEDELNGIAEIFFRSIGYSKIVCRGTDEIEMFIAKLAEDVPLVNEYFKIVEIADEEGLKWYRYHSNPYHSLSKIWGISTEFDGCVLKGEIIDFGRCSMVVMMVEPAIDLRMKGGNSAPIWGNEGRELANQLLINLYHAYNCIHDKLEVIRKKYKELVLEYIDYDRKIDEADDFEEREALDFERRNLFKQAFKEIIGYSIENIDSYLITNKLV